MSRRLANAAGIVAVALLILLIVLDLEGANGGWRIPDLLLAAAIGLLLLLSACWFVDRIVDAAFTRRHDLMRELVHDAVAEQIAATLEEFGGAMYRSGQIAGAARLDDRRPRVVSRDGD